MNRGAVFFDLGHTLATGLGRSVRRILGARLDLSEKDVKRVGRLVMTTPAMEPASLSASLARIIPGRSPGDIDRCIRSLWIEQEESVREVPGAARLIAALRDNGFQIGVLSNTWHPYVVGLQRRCGDLCARIDHWLLSYRIGAKKPGVTLFARALAVSALPPSRCWMVGDSYELDVAPAMRAGMPTVWLLVRPEAEREVLARILRGELVRPRWVSEDLQTLAESLDSCFLGTQPRESVLTK